MSSAVSYPSRARYTVVVEPLEDVLERLKNKRIVIPPHQRNFCWSLKKQERLIETVLNGIPMPLIIFRQHGKDLDPESVTSLEDGMQRLTTCQHYANNEFAVNNRKFNELTEKEQLRFNMYQVPVLTYRGLTDEQAIDTFDKFQNGVPLSVGERYHSLMELSPVIKLAKELLLTPGSGFHDRAIPIWGKHEGIGKRGGDLTMAVALVTGLAFSDEKNCYFSKKYDEMSDAIKRPLSKQTEDTVKRNINTILEIYEELQRRKSFTKKAEINFQWNLGNTTGYIAYSLTCMPGYSELLKVGWIKYLSEVREKYDDYSGTAVQRLHQCLELKLHKDVSGARSWNKYRWNMGYLRVFNPAQAEKVANSAETSSTYSDDDE
jgi:hypothetical protein